MAPTDKGLCQVYNGGTMKSTFSSTKRIEELSSALDKRESYDPKYINGSGTIYQKTFWLDIGDRQDKIILLKRRRCFDIVVYTVQVLRWAKTRFRDIEHQQLAQVFQCAQQPHCPQGRNRI